MRYTQRVKEINGPGRMPILRMLNTDKRVPDGAAKLLAVAEARKETQSGYAKYAALQRHSCICSANARTILSG